MMFPMKTMTPSKPSKQTSAAASKIKNKILNTSSFFKVSLKTNNKALALALQAQKEKSRQLEMEVVYLQKRVEALCFELAAKKYKQRKLLLILKNLHSNTLQHLDMVAELISDSDSLRLSEVRHTVTAGNREKDAATWLNDESDLRSEISRKSFWPNGNIQATPEKPERNTREDVFDVLTKGSKTPEVSRENAVTKERRLSQCVQATPTGTRRPSSSSNSLRSEVERLSRALSQPSFELTSVLCPQNSQAHDNSTPSFSSGVNAPSVSASETEPQLTKADNTVLLNTSMEITLSNAAEIVTVETKAKKKGPSGKPNGPKSQQAARSSSADVQKGLSQRAKKKPDDIFTQIIKQPPEDKDPELLDVQLPETLQRNVKTSRIPKLGSQQRGPNSNTGSCATTSQELDDYFSDPAVISVKAGGSDTIGAPAGSKITYRRSRTKVRRRSAVIQNILSASDHLLSHGDQSQQSELDKVHNEEEAENREPAPPQESIFCPEEGAGSESAEVRRKTLTKPRCRGTFVISVSRDSDSPDLDHDLILPVEPQCEAKELLNAQSPGQQPSHSALREKTRSSKRPLVETSEHNVEVLPTDKPDCSGPEFRKPKKSRREDAAGSRKKKTTTQEKCADGSNTRQKRKTKKSNKEVLSENEAALTPLCRDEPPVCSTYSPEVTKEGQGDFQMLLSHDSHDICESLNDPKFSKAMDDFKHRRTKLLSGTETGNQREIYVVHRRTTRNKSKSVSLNSSRTSIASDETGHQDVGLLLMDVQPPWLSTVDTESKSLPSSPTRSTSPEESARTSPAGGVLTMVTNTFTSPDNENEGRSRRRNCVVSYKEPPLNSKIRRGDKFTDTTFLSSPLFKDRKKKKQQKTVEKESPIVSSS